MQNLITLTQYSAHTDKSGRTIPRATEGACLRHQATTTACNCPDHKNRKGGSYTCPFRGNLICKHIYRRRVQSLQQAHAALRLIPRMAYLEI
jgi:hypothetical protein